MPENAYPTSAIAVAFIQCPCPMLDGSSRFQVKDTGLHWKRTMKNEMIDQSVRITIETTRV
jgi:hypothetical protein